jgi:hypothetical protein
MTALVLVEAGRLSKKAHDLFAWQCFDQLGGGPKSDKKTNLLTDLKFLGEQHLGKSSARANEFYVRDGDRLRGPVRMYITKDSRLSLRFELWMQLRAACIWTVSFDKISDIEIPGCMSDKK